MADEALDERGELEGVPRDERHAEDREAEQAAQVEEGASLVDEDAADLALMEELAREEAEAEAAINEDPGAQPAPAELEDMSQWDLMVLFDDILVQQVEAPTTLKPGGKIEAADAYKDRHRPLEGYVVMVGEGKPLADGSLRPMRVRVGDRVHYGPHSGSDLFLPDGRQLVVLKEDEVLALWRERPQESPMEGVTELTCSCASIGPGAGCSICCPGGPGTPPDPNLIEQ